MSSNPYIHGHFDGKTFVPDEPVDMPVNQPVVIHIVPATDSSVADRTERRKIAMRQLLQACASDPDIPLSALRRDTDNENEGYGY